MVSFPQSGVNQSGVSSDLSYSYKKKESAELSVTKELNDGQSKLQVSASYSSTVTISGTRESSPTYAPQAAAPVEQISEIPERTQAAQNILSFIEARMRMEAAEGASEEELQARLEEGLSGFLKGYNEAYDQLAGTGLLSDDVEAAIEQTKADVLSGINDLAEELGIESPVAQVAEQASDDDAEPVTDSVSQISSNNNAPVTPQDTFSDFASDIVGGDSGLSQLLESTALRYESVAKRDFSFTLKTQDGDKITITANASQEARLGYGSVDYSTPHADYNATAVNAEFDESNQFNVKVKGELDEAELAAINDLLSQVGDISESFFSGNIEEAFEMALNIGFDSDEIAKFSLKLNHEVSSVVETTYAKVQDTYKPEDAQPHVGESKNGMQSFKEQLELGGQNSSIVRMKNFVSMLQDLAKSAQEMGIERRDVPKLVGDFASSRKDDVDAGERIQSFTENMLDAMES
ncbi:MAG: DUF5610 domain-containing protein [Agarilytica sp.]